MANKKTILSEEIELSEIVLKKTNQAFEMIKQEDIVSMKKTHKRRKKMFKTQAAAAAGVCILAVSGISAAAAVHHYWGRGMNGNIQASDEQQQALTEKNIAKGHHHGDEPGPRRAPDPRKPGEHVRQIFQHRPLWGGRQWIPRL